MNIDGVRQVQGEDVLNQEEKDKKRYKKEDGTSVSGQSNGSAASPEDDRWVQ
jgi:hypothetical protein